ncbi:TIGR00645 family protein [Lentisphaera marina]|uniref:TIGR00645 family protein n=1 Tax=Lentisphaera marina TaxID=1111041 RepID=UPI0023651448|nr:TIGR00645 family protein [Lentisphaera marina]MDD7984449.1 TIGR00645 family protein [Lentisphaera marina]
MLKKVENAFEQFLFASRWLLAPFYLGLVVGLALLLVKFSKEVFHLVTVIGTITKPDLIISVLTLIDISLIANLLVIITFSAYESFVSKIEVAIDEDKPGWMGKVGFGQLKIKLIGSIVAISSIELLKVFMREGALNSEEVKLKIAMHITFVFSGLLMALMDWLSNKK